MATLARVKNRTLELLGVLTIGQKAQNKDSVKAQEAYNEVYAELKKEGIAVWSSTGNVPDSAAAHVIALAAFNLIDDYGVSNDRYNRITAKAQVAKAGIRRAVTPKYESLHEPDDY